MYKTHTVVMLATKEKSNIVLIAFKKSDELIYLPTEHIGTNLNKITFTQHLYILSDEIIEATTDTSLNLPKIPNSFIEKFVEEYNKGNIIKKVMVEYETDFPITCNSEGVRNYPNLVINSDNTINIKLAKESWNKRRNNIYH